MTLSDIIKRLQLDPAYPRDEIVRDLTRLLGSGLGASLESPFRGREYRAGDVIYHKSYG